MSKGERAEPAIPAVSPPAAESYEPPRVIWREPYEPASFGVSCAKLPGSPQCNPGPIST